MKSVFTFMCMIAAMLFTPAFAADAAGNAATVSADTVATPLPDLDISDVAVLNNADPVKLAILRGYGAKEIQRIANAVAPRSASNNRLLEILTMLAPFATIVFIVFIAGFLGLKKRQSNNKLMETAILHGRDIPSDYFINNGGRRPKSRLNSGLVLIGTGIGLMLFLLQCADSFWALGLIPIFIGVANLITYFVEDCRNARDEAAD